MSVFEPSLEDQIKARAHSLGFSLAGITSAEPLANHPRYVEWLQAGFQAGMKYLASDYHIHKRRDPTALVPWAKSILVLGLPYTLQQVDVEFDQEIGLVSGYAAGEDYHLRIPKMVSPLLEFLDVAFRKPVQAQVFTDSSPILERELGVRAGLGWIGKNSCLISKEHGSAFLLAEVFIDQELVWDSPYNENNCGTCQRCIQACPTGCINSDQTIDASRCISYLTIEHRGEIPREIAEKMGDWVFGCDICQAVCPWNVQATKTPLVQTELRYFSVETMTELLELDEAEFHARFANSAISRAKLLGLKRNLGLRLAGIQRHEH